MKLMIYTAMNLSKHAVSLVLILGVFCSGMVYANYTPQTYTLAGVNSSDEPYNWVGRLGPGSAFPVSNQICLTAAHVVFRLQGGQNVPRVWNVDPYNPAVNMSEAGSVSYPQAIVAWSSYSAALEQHQLIQRDGEWVDSYPSDDEKSTDFAALYFSHGNGHSGYPSNGISYMNIADLVSSANEMVILGYPSDGIASGDQGYPHVTGPGDFEISKDWAIYPVSYYEGHFDLDNAYSRGGNSGGPIYHHDTNGAWSLAGVYIAGNGEKGTGKIIDSDAVALISEVESLESYQNLGVNVVIDVATYDGNLVPLLKLEDLGVSIDGETVNTLDLLPSGRVATYVDAEPTVTGATEGDGLYISSLNGVKFITWHDEGSILLQYSGSATLSVASDSPYDSGKYSGTIGFESVAIELAPFFDNQNSPGAPQAIVVGEEAAFAANVGNFGTVVPDSVEIYIRRIGTSTWPPAISLSTSDTDARKWMNYSVSVPFPSVGNWEYYFEATIGDAATRFPEAGQSLPYLQVTEELEVTEGWDAQVTNVSVNKTRVSVGGSIQLNSLTIKNNSDAGNDYSNLVYEATLTKSGALIDDYRGQLSSLSAGASDTEYPTNWTFANLEGGAYVLSVTVSPSLDSDWGNNTKNIDILVTDAEVDEQHWFSDADLEVVSSDIPSSQSYYYNGTLFAADLFNIQYIGIAAEGEAYRSCYVDDVQLLRGSGNGYVLLDTISVSGSVADYYYRHGEQVVGRLHWSNGVKLYGYPGDRVETSGSISNSATFVSSKSNSNISGNRFAKDSVGDTGSSWMDVDRSSSSLNVAFDIPSNANAGSYNLTYLILTSDGRYAQKFTVTVLQRSPKPTSISSGNFRVGDSVTITGTDFGSSPTVKVDGIAATITSKSNTSVTFTIPEGASTGSVVISNSGGAAEPMLITIVTAPEFMLQTSAGGSTTASHDFGSVELGTETPPTHSFRIANTGNASLLVGNFSAPSEIDYGFRDSSLNPLSAIQLSIAAGDYVYLDLTYEPDGVGEDSHSFSFETNDSESQNVSISLVGEGVDTTSPTVTILSPSDETVNTIASVVSLSGSFSDETAVSLSYTFDGGVPTAITPTGFSWTVQGLSLVEERDYVVVVTAEDAHGNTGTDTVTFNYTIPYVLTLNKSIEEAGEVIGADDYWPDAEVTARAIEYDNYNFLRWEKNGVLESTEANYTFDLSEDTELTAIFEPDLPAVEFATSPLSISEGEQKSVNVTLSRAPLSNVTVSIAKSVGGDADIALRSAASLSFTTTNWNVAQSVEFAAAEDADAYDGEATYSFSGTGVIASDLTVSESDNDEPPYLNLNLVTASFDRLGGKGSFVVSSNVQWSWSSDVDWIWATEDEIQSGNQLFEYVVEGYNGVEARVGIIQVGDEYHVITQTGKAIPLGIEIDSDSDGLQDSWENEYFSSLTHLSGSAGLDPDQDGQSNWFESQFGLDPLDAGERFEFYISYDSISNDVDVVFSPIKRSRTYTVKKSSTLLPGSWSSVSEAATVTENGDERTVTEGAVGPSCFYVVVPGFSSLSPLLAHSTLGTDIEALFFEEDYNDGYTLTSSGGVQSWIGKFGLSVTFGGIDGQIVLDSPLLPSSSDFTLSMWVEPSTFNSTEGNNILFSQEVDFLNGVEGLGSAGVCGSFDAETKQFSFNLRRTGRLPDPLINSVSSSVVTLHSWHHYLVRCSEFTFELYVDGIKQGAFQGLYSLDQVNLIIGGGVGSDANHFEGNIDQFLLYERALTDEEIAALYGSGDGLSGEDLADY